jgi:hypothetical protein
LFLSFFTRRRPDSDHFEQFRIYVLIGCIRKYTLFAASMGQCVCFQEETGLRSNPVPATWASGTTTPAEFVSQLLKFENVIFTDGTERQI